MITVTSVPYTDTGIKGGDTIETLPFKQIDGNSFPVFKAVVTEVEFVLFDNGVMFYSITAKCKRNPRHWKTLKIDSKNVRKL